jgi:prolipoprotein diacylglyceryltransferase
MKVLLWVGLVALVLGIASFFIPIPRHEREGLRAGDLNLGVEVKHEEHVSLIVSTVLIVAGAGMMIASKGRKAG